MVWYGTAKRCFSVGTPLNPFHHRTASLRGFGTDKKSYNIMKLKKGDKFTCFFFPKEKTLTVESFFGAATNKFYDSAEAAIADGNKVSKIIVQNAEHGGYTELRFSIAVQD